jgi:hypothetical protein
MAKVIEVNEMKTTKQQESKRSHPKGLGDSPKGYDSPKPWLKTGTARQSGPKVVTTKAK